MKRWIALGVLALALDGCAGSGPPSPITSAYIVQQLQASGLNLANVAPDTTPRPGAVDAVNFDLPNVGIGSVTTYASTSDAQAFASARHASKGSPWHFQKGIAVLVLSVSVDEATALQFEKAFNDLKY